MAEAAEWLREVLAARRVLLVADDVWTTVAAAAFRVTGRGRVVYTSRDLAAIDASAAALCAPARRGSRTAPGGARSIATHGRDLRRKVKPSVGPRPAEAGDHRG